MHTPLISKLRTILHNMRKDIPSCTYDTTCAALSDIRTGYLDGKPVRRLVVTLRAPGCAWTADSGGCTMCGHWAGTTRGIIPSCTDTMTQFVSELDKYDLTGISVLSIYNSGSMLNPKEVSPETLKAMFQHIRSIPSIRKVVLETRAEYIDPAYVQGLAQILAPQAQLTIAMGLETADDTRRELCLNKGVTSAEIAAATISVSGIAEIQLYVLAGLPFLTEAESIDDAVDTIRFAHKLGASEVHIEPLTIQRYTLIERLAARNIVTLPSLHSIYEILRRVVPDIRPYVSPFMHMPLPERIPGSCPSCSQTLVDRLIHTYNLARDRSSLDHSECACIDDWRASLEITDPRPLEDRVADALDVLAGEALSC